ncbi:MAG: hypothetical protein A2268_09505 [Candidatus Raymondbacteria bacterium RifOxyA12_full_50_37]|uniref:tRNA-dihydrouridine synthase n=1 Tax=Candidatus Raymondbacteria bacterium RIFOXYD12_FULL_49_13 TaxID=1817890 RepID=A0A1F7F1A5_UNCRA|nr:MAG: hypothetical protein A2268_09505 [Candidatus Raymondbacteria bacterium RifOxyA12_full_50_37]OGJ93924.1 MAG: hypothetical protein A2248_06790 [Candidatus Raymondbacteria bacterium RIFOXYA2_FULL_49_16]OGJ98207.1 MAG: hypothetical protein A2453_00375 [Candidatus Raymondbacteria bacterium RIFOXYC2_FULL_50_21]OGK00440.1 MAG: hypothetical protein A2519_10550 [Candidatus Raymondbacteria bacterium RIFOXYD12_FULL_49_13]OGP45430.1 MAG: hypothetical protein A2324_22560 [Candidatus Raymondbacteria 
MCTPLKIRDGVVIDPPLIQAPMSGITGRAFRQFIRELNPGCVGLYYSEFVSVEGMTRFNRPTLRLMEKSPEDSQTLYAIQIFGANPSRMAIGARMAQEHGANVVDINCGCPAPRIVKKGGGAELLKKPEQIGEIIAAVKAAVFIPVAVKIRLGWSQDTINCFEVADIVQQAGADLLTVHGRTKEQGFQGLADWELIGRVRERLTIPVVGNGDIKTPEDYDDRVGSSGVPAVMIGRGMLSDPWIFRKIIAHRAGKPEASILDFKYAMFPRYAELLRNEGLHAQAILGKGKQMAVRFLRGKAGCSHLRTQALRSNTFQEFMENVRLYIDHD